MNTDKDFGQTPTTNQITIYDPEGKATEAKAYGNVQVTTPGYRPNTRTKRYRHNFVMTNGGLGDFINHMAVFQYLAEQCPHMQCRLFCMPPFLEVAQWLMEDHEHFIVYRATDAPRVIKPGEIIYDPGQWTKYINATGAHLLDLGFLYYASMDRAMPDYNRLPSLMGYSSGQDWGLPDQYAVMTPGYTANARALPPDTFNHIKEHLLTNRS
jgi:hypothetical protein